jgi:hypothetical protein
MPIYVVYPVEPNLLKRILDLLGKPKIVEISVSVDDERLRDMLKPDEARSITVQYSCEPEAEKALDLYREYYESYISISRFPAERKPKVISSFKASWYLNDLSVEFDGFSLRIKAEGDLRKAFEIMQLLKGRVIRVEIDLSCPEHEKSEVAQQQY